MGSGAFEGGEDAVEMIFEILMEFGGPHHFFFIDDFAIDDRGHLAVASPGVEADAAAFEVAPIFMLAFFMGGSWSISTYSTSKGAR